jgi:hypothetical protein
MLILRIAVAAGLAGAASGAVTGIDMEQRSEVMGGHAFGSAGKYEKLKGTVRFAVDPETPRNRGITDILLAPRNAKGLVEFSADFYMLRPKELSKGNGTLLFEVVNRGKKGMLSMFDRAKGANEPEAPEELGDGLLLDSGYTLVWLGWQHDVPPGSGIMRLHAPAIPGVKGLVRSEFTPDQPTRVIPLGDSGHVPYPVTGKVSVSVRDEIYGARKSLPPGQWSVDSAGNLRLLQPAQPGRLYEVLYESSNPVVAGLALAGIRDLVSHLKRDHQRAIGFGVSQSAMVLKALVYEGFNQDEAGNRVFDGIFAHVAGGRRSTFQRFVQPSRTAGPLRNASMSTTEQFPFSDVMQSDPATGVRDSLLRKAEAARVVPKIFYTNSTYEYWGSAASLLHTSVDGSHDVDLPSTTRMYVFAGGQHGPAAFPPRPGKGQNLANFNDYRWPLRALLAKLEAWVRTGDEPPASVYPSIAAGTLVPLSKYAFPAAPAISVPTVIHTPHRLDFGGDYSRTGVALREPPRVLAAYTVLVPQADADGNDTGGLRMPEIDCGLGTFTGWNLRRAEIGNSRLLLGNTGSYLPFARTASERRASGDPRKSVEERFATSAAFQSCVEQASAQLAARGFLLESDRASVARMAMRHWRWRIEEPSPVSSARP